MEPFTDLIDTDDSPAALAERVEHLTISTTEDLRGAVLLLQGVIGERKEIAAFYAPEIARAHSQHKSILDSRNTVDAPWAAAESSLRREVLAYVEGAYHAQRQALEEGRLPPELPTADGLSLKDQAWELEVVDEAALFAAVAAGKAPRDLLKFDAAAGRRYASQSRDLTAIPGTRAVRKLSIAVRVAD